MRKPSSEDITDSGARIAWIPDQVPLLVSCLTLESYFFVPWLAHLQSGHTSTPGLGLLWINIYVDFRTVSDTTQVLFKRLCIRLYYYCIATVINDHQPSVRLMS